MAFLNVSMPDELLQRIEAYSQRERISKSALVQKGMTDYLNAVDSKSWLFIYKLCIKSLMNIS